MGAKWPKFMVKLKSLADKDDPNVIDYKEFLKLIEEFGIKFTDREQEIVMQAYVSNSDRKNVKISIAVLHNIKNSSKIRKIYDKLDMYEEQEDPDLVDNSGYFGEFYRKKVNLDQISEKQIIEIISK